MIEPWQISDKIKELESIINYKKLEANENGLDKLFEKILFAKYRKLFEYYNDLTIL